MVASQSHLHLPVAGVTSRGWFGTSIMRVSPHFVIRSFESHRPCGQTRLSIRRDSMQATLSTSYSRTFSLRMGAVAPISTARRTESSVLAFGYHPSVLILLTTGTLARRWLQLAPSYPVDPRLSCNESVTQSDLGAGTSI